MQSRRNVFLWVLYDFANSIVAVVFFLYFAQWAVIDRGVTDFRFNLTFTISAFLLLVTVPQTGLLLDIRLKRITGLRTTTVFTAIFYAACAAFALINADRAALITFTIGIYLYLLSFTFYTPLLNDIAPESKRGYVSGLGIMANYAGQFVGLLAVLPFSNGSFSFFHGTPRAETLLPAVILFFLCSLPMLLFFRESPKAPSVFPDDAGARRLLTDTRHILFHSGAGLFLLSYFLFNDAILTVLNNFPIYLEQVWAVSDQIKTYIMLGILITSGIGGILGGLIADRIGHHKTLLWIIGGWVFLFPLVGLLPEFKLFVGSITLMGFWYGATWTVSRSVMGYLAPKKNENLTFAYYGLAERASSFVGPIAWGLMVTGLVSMGNVRYRIAIVALTVFIAIGFFVLKAVKMKR